MAGGSKREDRVLNPDGRRHFRKTYRVGEAYWGTGIVFGLSLVLAWVLHKGAHPDPTLFESGADLLVPGEARAEDRGPLPQELAPNGWQEGLVRRFGQDDLYVKINGREGYYKSFGFESLTFVSLLSEKDASQVIDIELFDQGTTANALGAYAGERAPGVSVDITTKGLRHTDRNSAFVTSGRYYARIIGSSESEGTVRAVAAVQGRLTQALPGDTLPWGYRLLLRLTGVSASEISFYESNAFSFAFGKNVYAAKMGPGETEVFVTPTQNSDAASAVAGQFVKAFGEQGEAIPGSTPFTRDRYLGEHAGATPYGVWVIGVRAAPTLDAAEAALTTLRNLLDQAPATVLAEAQQTAKAFDAPDDEPK